MGKFIENRENSITKVKTQMKEEVMEYIIECLIEKYGIENCGYVRNGNGQSKTKEYAVRTGIVEANGEEYESVVCINASAKDYREHTSDKGKVYTPYEFNIMRELYETYLEEKASKDSDKKLKKEKKIAKDKEQREKKVNLEDF